jgi:hypothetical protein
MIEVVADQWNQWSLIDEKWKMENLASELRSVVKRIKIGTEQ